MEQEISFGEWLGERRNAIDLTQWELAERVGCSRDTIQKIEAGKRRPSKQVAELLAACLGVAPEDRSAFVNWARLGRRSAPPTDTPLPPPPSIQSSVQPIESLVPTNLPTPLTSLVGREQVIESVCRYLLRDDVRLLSLIGPPGVGKTRLSIATAASIASAFNDRVHFVALDTISDPNLVANAVADSLKLRPLANQTALDAVQQHLRSQRALLVLDNFEQVLDAGADVLKLINACPGLKVLVTSREALHVYGEWRFTVQPLKLPDANTRSELNVDALSNVPAVALFIQRAQAIKSDLALTQDNATVISKICTRLDGLPLAIELAATRVSSLSLDEILSGLGRLKLLRGNLRNLPPRQRTVRGAIDWSYELLQSSERALFRRMGVFAGGCTLAAIEAVCNAPDLQDSPSATDFELIEECQSLIEKSLLRHESEKKNGEGRYAMLEVIRECALEKLQANGEEQAIRRLHAQYYLALAENAAPRLNGPEQSKVLQELESDNDNIRAALRWSIEGGIATIETAVRMSGALGKFWDIRGYASEGRRWLGEALEIACPSLPTDDAATAAQSISANLSPYYLIRALTAAGSLAAAQGDQITARSYHQRALTISREANHQVAIGTCLLNLANVSNHLGEYSEAMALFDQALTIFRELENKPNIARTLLNMGFCAQSRGDNGMARALYEESLTLRRELGDQYGIAMALANLGEIAADQGNHDHARVLLEEGLSIRKEIGDERGIAFCLTNLASLESTEQHYTQAFDLFQQGLCLYQKAGDQEGTASCLGQLSHLCMSTGQAIQSVRLWGAVESLRRAIRAPIPLADRSRYEQAVAQARAELGDEVFTPTWAEGSQMTMEDAIAYALEIISQQTKKLT